MLLRSQKHAWPEATIHVINDVTAAGYRHLRDFGEDLCVVMVSSGIGNKVFIGGSPQLGPSNLGGEIGHHQVDDSPDAPICGCGGRGHLGAIASGRGALRLARRLALEDRRAFASSLAGKLVGGDPSSLDNPSLARAFRERDPWAVHVIGLVAEPLARSLAGMHLALGIERFVLIGGFAFALGRSIAPSWLVERSGPAGESDAGGSR